MILLAAILHLTSAQACDRHHGRNYIVCRESGPAHVPRGLPPGTAHPGRSSATGPCGMLAEARRRHGGDDLEACARYMLERYGTWEAAEAHERKRGWW